MPGGVQHRARHRPPVVGGLAEPGAEVGAVVADDPHDRGGGAADRLAGGDAGEQLGGGVEVGDVAVLVDGDEGVAHAADHALHAGAQAGLVVGRLAQLGGHAAAATRSSR